MEISAFSRVSPLINSSSPAERTSVTPHEAQQSFQSMLSNAIENVNQTSIESDVATEKMARGEDIDLHSVMIAAQKSSIMLQTTVEVRNKVVEAYQEVMRMQV